MCVLYSSISWQIPFPVTCWHYWALCSDMLHTFRDDTCPLPTQPSLSSLLHSLPWKCKPIRKQTPNDRGCNTKLYNLGDLPPFHETSILTIVKFPPPILAPTRPAACWRTPRVRPVRKDRVSSLGPNWLSVDQFSPSSSTISMHSPSMQRHNLAPALRWTGWGCDYLGDRSSCKGILSTVKGGCIPTYGFKCS